MSPAPLLTFTDAVVLDAVADANAPTGVLWFTPENALTPNTT
jgi:hypothetical protein